MPTHVARGLIVGAIVLALTTMLFAHQIRVRQAISSIVSTLVSQDGNAGVP